MLATMPHVVGSLCRGHRQSSVGRNQAVEINRRYDEISAIMAPFPKVPSEDRLVPVWKITVAGVPGDGWTVAVDGNDLDRIYKNLRDIGLSLGNVALNRLS